MATLQKFKLLATQCAVAGSPSRSPTTSPVIQIRRRKTLRMLLGRRRHDHRSPDRTSPEKVSVGHKLKDLFVSSPPPENVREGFIMQSGGGACVRRGGGGGGRMMTATLRQRLLRRAWRPVLVGIPEEHF